MESDERMKKDRMDGLVDWWDWMDWWMDGLDGLVNGWMDGW